MNALREDGLYLNSWLKMQHIYGSVYNILSPLSSLLI